MPYKKRVLFLCTGNSARSQMAEGLLRHLAGDRYEVFSAGTMAKGLHPCTIATMKEIGIDVSHQRSKNVQEFQGQTFDYVITVCDRARQSCPIFPGVPPIHWEFEDPAAADVAVQERVFRQIREEIRGRLERFIHKDTN
jgi:thioredoxin type arsenate reductase